MLPLLSSLLHDAKLEEEEAEEEGCWTNDPCEQRKLHTNKNRLRQKKEKKEAILNRSINSAVMASDTSVMASYLSK